MISNSLMREFDFNLCEKLFEVVRIYLDFVYFINEKENNLRDKFNTEMLDLSVFDEYLELEYCDFK